MPGREQLRLVNAPISLHGTGLTETYLSCLYREGGTHRLVLIWSPFMQSPKLHRLWLHNPRSSLFKVEQLWIPSTSRFMSRLEGPFISCPKQNSPHLLKLTSWPFGKNPSSSQTCHVVTRSRDEYTCNKTDASRKLGMPRHVHRDITDR